MSDQGEQMTGEFDDRFFFSFFSDTYIDWGLIANWQTITEKFSEKCCKICQYHITGVTQILLKSPTYP